MKTLKLMIGGDFAPTQSNEESIKNKEFIQELDEKFKIKWLEADLRIFNLECVLCDEKERIIKKNGSSVRADKETIHGIASLKPNVVCLANNHSLDYGEKGLNTTIDLLNKNNIKYTGIIERENERLEDCILVKNGLKIGIYNVCENEFSTITYFTKGTNSLNEAKNCMEIMRLKEKVDYVIVIFHGGREHFRYVSPNCQRICRNFIDFGADIVITQHTHCVGCKEEYNNGTIIYGQGDFLFDSPDEEDRSTGLLIEINFNEKNYMISYVPIDKNKSLFKISENPEILKSFFSRSEEIKNYYILLQKYNDFCNSKINGYLKAISGNKLIYKIMDKLYKNKYFLNQYYNEKNLLQLLNYIDCESHRELLKQGLINKLFHDSKK